MEIPNALSHDLRTAIEAAQQAGRVIMTAFQGDITAETKGDKGLVTAFDKKAEQTIRAVLEAKSPYSILGEESGLSHRDAAWVWVVDPIDGTTNFSRKIPLFAVSIALLRGREIALGVILNPNSNECYFAERGKGAYRNGLKMKVSTTQNPERAVIFLNHGYRTDDLQRMAHLTARLGSTYSTRTLGTTALELCWVANGLVDAFICSGDELWDYAAGVLLVQEAGGKFTDWRGDAWDGQQAFIFASNGPLHAKLLKDIEDLQP